MESAPESLHASLLSKEFQPVTTIERACQVLRALDKPLTERSLYLHDGFAHTNAFRHPRANSKTWNPVYVGIRTAFTDRQRSLVRSLGNRTRSSQRLFAASE